MPRVTTANEESMMTSIDAVSLLVAQLGSPFPIQETITVFVILTGGGLLAWLLATLPTVEWLSGWAAVGTMALTVLLGHYDVAIGDGLGRVMAPACVGWDAYVSPISKLGARYELVLPQTHPASLTIEDSRALAYDVHGMAGELTRLTPPDAAKPVHENLLTVFAETETQLHHHAAGHGFDRSTINGLLDQHRSLATTANRACR
jgi:hypothetical protein